MTHTADSQNAGLCHADQKIWKYLRQRVSALDNWEQRPALVDGKDTLTYHQFFQKCDQYAAVFSALTMTQRNKARVGLISTGAVETITAFYALNMTGAEVSLISSLSVLKAEKIQQVVRDEHLTDLIITDDLIQDTTLSKIILNKDKLKLRFILLLHIPVNGCTVPIPLAASMEQKSKVFQSFLGPLYMDQLVRIYGNTPIVYADDHSNASAVILHTSGTTGGSGTPIVMSDRALNAMCGELITEPEFDDLKQNPSCALTVDLSNVYGTVIQVHLPLCLGGKVVTVPGYSLNPLFFRIIPEEQISVLFCVGAVLEMWMKMSELEKFDFSSLKCLVLGGTAVSADDKRRYHEFLSRHHGSHVPILNGYGLSELGGVCILSTDDLEDDSIGKLLRNMEARLYEEESETYLTTDAPGSGVLYLHSETMSSCFLDGKEIIKTVLIDGKPFICTNDLVRVDESGKFTYLGRANRYFLHHQGAKYQSGRVEAEISRQPGIRSCGIVPVFDKPNHDNIPMLCVETTAEKNDSLSVVQNALRNVFFTDKVLSPDDLPVQVLLSEELPRNANGKIDLYQLNRGQIPGELYNVEVKRIGEELTDLRLNPLQKTSRDILSEVYRGIVKDFMDESVPVQIMDGMKQYCADCLTRRPNFTNTVYKQSTWYPLNTYWQIPWKWNNLMVDIFSKMFKK